MLTLTAAGEQRKISFPLDVGAVTIDDGSHLHWG